MQCLAVSTCGWHQNGHVSSGLGGLYVPLRRTTQSRLREAYLSAVKKCSMIVVVIGYHTYTQSW